MIEQGGVKDGLDVEVSGAILNAIASPLTAGWDYFSITYVAAGNGAGEVETITYKSGGAGGTTIAIVTYTYNGDNKVETCTRT